MLQAIGEAVTEVIGWVGEILTALVSTDGPLNALLPIFAIGIGVTAVTFGIKIVRGFAWGSN